MPKGIHPLLTADLLHALASMGHGDEIAIVDANSPAARLARHAFYERASRATAILRTGELRPYGNILLVKGVVNRYEPAPQPASADCAEVIVVCGSINLDLVARVPRFVQPGETLAGEGFATHPGGKGANQAVAAARAGAAVKLVGAVGRDAFAGPALELARAAGIDISRVRALPQPTGIALIEVTAGGENAIVVVAGANGEVVAADVPDEWLDAATVVVLQNEIPAAANAGLAARARARGARVVYNAAPARDSDGEMRGLASVLVVNETEMRAMATTVALPAEAGAFAAEWARRSGGVAIVTLGGEGVVAAEPGASYRFRAPAVSIVDTTGAGDAFVGALAAALDAGSTLRDALPRAVAAGSLACTSHGAQPSLPDAAAIAALAATLVTLSPPAGRGAG